MLIANIGPTATSPSSAWISTHLWTPDFPRPLLCFHADMNRSCLTPVLAHALQNAACVAMEGRWVVFGLMGGAVPEGPIFRTVLTKRLQVPIMIMLQVTNHYPSSSSLLPPLSSFLVSSFIFPPFSSFPPPSSLTSFSLFFSSSSFPALPPSLYAAFEPFSCILSCIQSTVLSVPSLLYTNLNYDCSNTSLRLFKHGISSSLSSALIRFWEPR